MCNLINGLVAFLNPSQEGGGRIQTPGVLNVTLFSSEQVWIHTVQNMYLVSSYIVPLATVGLMTGKGDNQTNEQANE